LIDKLELLLALAKERHFGRAAEACGVTQPTMSTSLKQLEEFLGVMLVQRGSRFQGFTPEGERALDWARRIVGDARAMRQEINSLKEGLSGEIAIAAIPTALGMVASLTTPFRARHPNVRFRIISSTSVKKAFGYDDSLDAFGVHCIGGIVGAILTGVFAVKDIGGADGSVILQAKGVLTTLIYSGVVSFVLLKIIDMTMGIRVTEEQEREGLDVSLHGEHVE